MITAAQALSSIPAGLRGPLIAEYQTIVQNFLEHRWLPAELSGGRFSEIVYTILDGHARNSYAPAPSKPASLVDACRSLERNSAAHIPRSFKILIPRMLPVLYEIRNNRSVGHVGGDVDPNHMDSVAVLSMCNWVMAELARVFHGLTIAEAQKVVDTLAEMRIPTIWTDGNVKRVLQPKLKVNEQLLLLAAASVPDVSSADLVAWTEKSKKHVMATIRKLHTQRLVEYNSTTDAMKILPPGAAFVVELVRRKNLMNIA
jgi:hypothetical protein